MHLFLDNHRENVLRDPDHVSGLDLAHLGTDRHALAHLGPDLFVLAHLETDHLDFASLRLFQLLALATRRSTRLVAASLQCQ